MDWVEALKLLPVYLGLWVGVRGIDAWRREHVGKRRIELAEDTLALFYQAADAIRHMRSPAGFGYEMEDVKRSEGESDGAFQARQQASVMFYRYNQYKELFSQLHASRYRFMAQIGKREAQPFDEIRRITGKLLTSARALARLWGEQRHRDAKQEEGYWDRIGKHEAVFWEGLEDEDLINLELDKVMSTIEATCNRIITEKGELRGILSWRHR